ERGVAAGHRGYVGVTRRTVDRDSVQAPLVGGDVARGQGDAPAGAERRQTVRGNRRRRREGVYDHRCCAGGRGAAVNDGGQGVCAGVGGRRVRTGRILVRRGEDA